MTMFASSRVEGPGFPAPNKPSLWLLRRKPGPFQTGSGNPPFARPSLTNPNQLGKVASPTDGATVLTRHNAANHNSPVKDVSMQQVVTLLRNLLNKSMRRSLTS